MTLSDLQGHSLIASLIRCNFSYSFAVAQKIFIDTEHYVVPCMAM